MPRGGRFLLSAAVLGALAACTEQALAPGACPEFCPGHAIQMHDTILTTVIVRDSAFRGYIDGHRSELLPMVEVPGVVASRAIFRLAPMFTRTAPDPPDTSTVPITLDSARLRVTVARRDTNTANLWLKIYRLPTTIDSVTTFADLTPWFQDSIVDSVNVNDLLARPPIGDTATVRIWGDTIRTDSAGHVLQFTGNRSLLVHFSLDTTQARFGTADTGRVAFGVRIAADSLPTASLGSADVANGASIRWFYSYPDTTIKQANEDRNVTFDSFVVDPPFAPLDAHLTVGGAPSARSLLRVDIPPFMRDTTDVVRATLVLVQVAPVPGVRSDSFRVLLRPVITDVGAKSPLNPEFASVAAIRIESADTVRLEITNLIRAWAFDTSAATAFVLSQIPEAATYTEVRFYSSRSDTTAAQRLRPRLHVTYVRRFPFGEP